MSEAKIADTRPMGVEMKEGEEKYFCACGRSSGQPFCDGSHKETGFSPIPFKAQRSGKNFLCMCKHSKNLPYCDGSHSKL